MKTFLKTFLQDRKQQKIMEGNFTFIVFKLGLFFGRLKIVTSLNFKIFLLSFQSFGKLNG